jgi:MYXO-CTERM domain-containing protein
VLAVKHVLIIAVASVGVAELLNTSVSEPAAWAVVLAGIAGSGFIGRRRTKKSIEIEDETPG